MNTLTLFPTPVSMFELGRDFTDEELNFIKQQDTYPNKGNVTSVDTYILNNDSLKELREFIKTSFDTFFKEIYSPKENVSLRLTQSWANYTSKGQFHHLHRHPNSFISGVLYVQTDSSKDKINFHRQGDQLSFTSTSWNLFNSLSWHLGVRNGVFLVFPSSLMHSVEPVDSDETRISIAVNTFLVGCLGDERGLDVLHLGGD